MAAIWLITDVEGIVRIGPYSLATVDTDTRTVFVSGQIGDPKLSLEEQLEQVFNKLERILAAAGSSLNYVLKTTVLLGNMDDFQTMNKMYAEKFGDHKPARETFAPAGLPNKVQVEISVIAKY